MDKKIEDALDALVPIVLDKFLKSLETKNSTGKEDKHE
jgi:hypothetical protein